MRKMTAEEKELGIQTLLKTLRVAGEKLGDEYPLPDDWESLVREIMVTRGRLRFRANPGKGTSERAACLLATFKWHAGGGSLWGPMGWSLRLGREEYDKIDTLAVLLRKGHSNAAQAWGRALGLA